MAVAAGVVGYGTVVGRVASRGVEIGDEALHCYVLVGTFEGLSLYLLVHQVLKLEVSRSGNDAKRQDDETGFVVEAGWTDCLR